MSLPGRKAPAGVSGVRRCLVTIVVSVLALVLTLVVISLSVGSSLPRTSLQDYLPVIVSSLGKLSSPEDAGGNRNSTAVGEELVQGGREPLVEQNGQGVDVNSGQPSPVTEKIERKEPDPVDPGDTTSTPDEDSSKDSPNAEQGEVLVQFLDISVRHFINVDEMLLALYCGGLLDLSSHIHIGQNADVDPRFYCTGTCDLYHGRWVLDTSGPLYTNNSCPIITQMQNCQGNGRPDKEYENWRWKPEQCILPRFDARKFLELMRGKTLAFVGDSVARNQMESLVCLLWQVRHWLKLFMIQHSNYAIH